MVLYIMLTEKAENESSFVQKDKLAGKTDGILDVLKYLDEEENGSILISGALLYPKSGNSDVFGIHLNKTGTFELEEEYD